MLCLTFSEGLGAPEPPTTVLTPHAFKFSHRGCKLPAHVNIYMHIFKTNVPLRQSRSMSDT